MSSVLSLIEQGRKLGEKTWRIEVGGRSEVIEELFSIDFAEAQKRLSEIARCGNAQIAKPTGVFTEGQRLFVRRPWVEGKALEPVVEPQVIESLITLVNQLPDAFVLFDLRPEHVVQTERGLVITNPGWSSMGTPPFAAPEQYGRGEITSKVGAYQLGVTISYLLRGEKPLDALSLLLPEVEPPLIDSLPSSLAVLVNRLLEADPKERPSCKRLQRHFRSWLKSVQDIRDYAQKKSARYENELWDELEDEPGEEASAGAAPKSYATLQEALEDQKNAALRKSITTSCDSLQSTAGSSWSSLLKQPWNMSLTGSLLILVGLPLVFSVGLGAYGYHNGMVSNFLKSTPQVTARAAGTVPTSNYLPPTWESKDGAEMVLVRPGTFYKGPRPGSGHGAQMVIAKLPAFYIDRYEVSNRQFSKFVAATGYKTDSRWKEYATEARMDHPVISVSWYDAQAYAQWAGKRLPTAEEWEKAARGDDGRLYPWGDKPDVSRLNCFESDLGNTSEPGSFSNGASPFGVQDMAGNVWEWVDAWYIPLGTSSELLPMQRIARGGCRSDVIKDCTILSERGVFPESGALVNSGFRCVFDPIEAKPGEVSKYPASEVKPTKAHKRAQPAKAKAKAKKQQAVEPPLDYDPYAPSQSDAYYRGNGSYSRYNYDSYNAPSNEGSLPAEFESESAARGSAAARPNYRTGQRPAAPPRSGRPSEQSSSRNSGYGGRAGDGVRFPSASAGASSVRDADLGRRIQGGHASDGTTFPAAH